MCVCNIEELYPKNVITYFDPFILCRWQIKQLNTTWDYYCIYFFGLVALYCVLAPHLWAPGWTGGSAAGSSGSRFLPGSWCRTDCSSPGAEVARLPSSRLLHRASRRRNPPAHLPRKDSQTYLRLRDFFNSRFLPNFSALLALLHVVLLLSHLGLAKFSVDNGRTDSEVRRLHRTEHSGLLLDVNEFEPGPSSV